MLGIAKKRFERVKVPALYEFLALGVWIGGPRLVSRSLVPPPPPPPPPPPNSVDPRVRWIAWPAQLAAPKTLGCARRSLRGSSALRACVRPFFFASSLPAPLLVVVVVPSNTTHRDKVNRREQRFPRRGGKALSSIFENRQR